MQGLGAASWRWFGSRGRSGPPWAQFPDHSGLTGREQWCSRKENAWCLSPTQKNRIRVQIFLLQPVICPGALGIWGSLAWSELDPPELGREQEAGGGGTGVHFE